jgi:hypothetical protein
MSKVENSAEVFPDSLSLSMPQATPFGISLYALKKWCHDTQHNGTQHNDIQRNGTQYYGLVCNTQHKRHSALQPSELSAIMLSVIMLSVAFHLLLC